MKCSTWRSTRYNGSWLKPAPVATKCEVMVSGIVRSATLLLCESGENLIHRAANQG